MATNRNDDKGYVRGARGIDGNKTDDFKMPKSDCSFGVEADYGAKSVTHDRLGQLIDDDCWNLTGTGRTGTWNAGPIRGRDVGGTSPYKDPPTGYHDTQPVKAYSPSGKYAKKGGRGQRSGD